MPHSQTLRISLSYSGFQFRGGLPATSAWVGFGTGLSGGSRRSAGRKAMTLNVRNEMPRVTKHMDSRKLRAGAVGARGVPDTRENTFREITNMHSLNANSARGGGEKGNTSKMHCSISNEFVSSRLDRKNHQN